MAVARPTPAQMAEVAASLGMSLTPTQIEEFLANMAGSFAGYDLVDAMPDHVPPPAETPLTAWYVKSEVAGAPEGKLKGRTVVLKDNVCLAGVAMTNGAATLEGTAAIVTISSVPGHEIDFAAGPYGAFKAAPVHHTQGLAHHLAAKGIRANSVSPGNTAFDGGVWQRIETGDPELRKAALAHNPTGRMGTPQEMASAAVFLASLAASFVTGTNLVVGGALTRGVRL